MDDSEIPIACSLTDAEFRRRRNEVLPQVMKKALEQIELENGFAYRFASGDEILRAIAEMINLERKCCEFLRFQITVETDCKDIRLEITGADGAKEFIAATFN